MTAETHSVDLGFDWTKIVTLKDDLGSEYKAMDWTGESGGHHISGELIFEELKAESREVTLTVTGVDGVTESFSWII